MKEITLMLLFSFCTIAFSYAQQDPMFTKYMFNTLNYNPGYAGSKGYLSAGILHRTQWWGVEGAPHSQSLWIHTPIKGNTGIGLNMMNDIIGPIQSLTANLNYAYMIPLNDNNKLSIGIQGGLTNWSANWNNLSYETPGDEAYTGDHPNYWLPNFGAGIFYTHTDKFYLGISVPYILENDLSNRFNDDGTTRETWAKQNRHYYFSTGMAIPLDQNKDYVFRPMILVKSMGFRQENRDRNTNYNRVGAPHEFDIDCSMLFHQSLWVGAAFRSSIQYFTNQKSSFDSVDFWLQYALNNGLRVGAAYDYTLSKLQQPARGSFEVMLGYEMDFKEKMIVTPRYF